MKDSVPPPPRQMQLAERIISRLRLRHLRLVVEVDEHRSVLHAARRMNMSQPAATKLLQDIEADFGVELFERSNRGVVPTAFGAALIRNARMILAQVGQAVLEVDDIVQGNAGRVVVGTLLAASSELLPRTIAHVLASRPGLAVSVVEGTNDVLIPALRTGEVDLVVGRLPVFRYRDEVVQERLFDAESLALVRPEHPLAGERGLELAQLRAYRWVLPCGETTLRRQIDQYFLDHGGSPAVPVESLAYIANRHLLRETDLIGVMPRPVARADLESGYLAALDLRHPLPVGSVGVSYSPLRNLSPAAAFFLRGLRDIGALINAQAPAGLGGPARKP